MPTSHTIYKLSCEDAISFVLEACWGFAEIDPDGHFVWVNKAFCEILNAPPDLVLGTTFEYWTHPEDRQLDNDLAAQVLNGEIPGYTLSKRYVQRGSTPQNPRIIWGMLSVVGKWSETKDFVGYRCQFRPYSDSANPQTKLHWKRVITWTIENWKTVATIIAVSTSLILGGSERLLSSLKKAKETADQVDSVLSLPSSLPGEQPPP